MTRQRQEIGAERLDVDRQSARRLRGVGVEVAAARANDFSDRARGLDCPGLIVGEHHRNEDRLASRRRGVEPRCQGSKIEPPFGIHRQLLDNASVEPATGKHRGVLDSRNEHATNRPRLSADDNGRRKHCVVRLRPAAGEGDVARIATDECCNRIPRMFDQTARIPTLGMNR